MPIVFHGFDWEVTLQEVLYTDSPWKKQECRVSEIMIEEGGSEDRLFTFSQEAGVRGHPRKLSFQQVYRKQKEVLTHAVPC